VSEGACKAGALPAELHAHVWSDLHSKAFPRALKSIPSLFHHGVNPYFETVFDGHTSEVTRPRFSIVFPNCPDNSPLVTTSAFGLIVVCFGRFWVRGLPFPNARHHRLFAALRTGTEPGRVHLG
jgi:hypothetical protein